MLYLFLLGVAGTIILIVVIGVFAAGKGFFSATKQGAFKIISVNCPRCHRNVRFTAGTPAYSCPNCKNPLKKDGSLLV